MFESSDVDGGSSVAVLNYLRRILDALDHPELVHMILRYLLALPDEQKNRPRSASVKQRRSTLMLLSKPNDKEPELNPSLFNLVDLLLNCTQSRNPQTVASALKLVTTILSKNHKYATGTLLNVTEVHIKEPLRTVGALHAEIESYLGLAENMVPGAEVNKEYDAFLKDVLNLMEAHPCSMKFLSLHGLNLPNQGAMNYMHAEIRKDSTIHHLTAGDALFKSLMAILSNFFTNNVEMNLNLTEAIVNLASCPNLRLEGWLAVEPSQYQFTANETFEEEDEDLRDVFRARRKPKWTDSGAPALMVALRSLQEQIECLREEIPDFNTHVANRKQAFQVHEELHEAMRSTANFPPPTPLGPPKSSHGEAPTNSWTPQIQNMLEGTISPLRSQSPRGRAHTIQPTVNLSPAPRPKLGSTATSPHLFSLSPTRSRDPRKSSLTANVLNDVNDAANAGVLKRTIRFPLKPRKQTGSPEPEQPMSPSNIVIEVPPLKKDDTIKEEPEEEERDESSSGTTAVDSGSKASESQDNGMEAFPSFDMGEMEDVAPAVEEEVKEPKKEKKTDPETHEATLSHVLTNVVILQEFVLELIAILQVRASLFQEVRFV